MSKPRILLAILAVLSILASIGTAAYPTVSDYYYSLTHRHTISDYSIEVEGMEAKKIEAMISEAQAYNQKLLKSGRKPGQIDDEELESYNKLLDVYGGGVMGYVRIPKIGVFLPIYHGTGEEVLQVGAGHIPSLSLPIGGEGTHSVLIGHSGLRTAVLFTDLDQLEKGDTFTVTVLKDVLTYEVDQISVVEPGDVELLKIVPGEDLCTLVTCTPYGVNTHRLLVRGHRIETPAESASEIIKEAAEGGESPVIPAIICIASICVVCICIILILRRRKKNRTSSL